MKPLSVTVLLLVLACAGVRGQTDAPEFRSGLLLPGASLRDQATPPIPLRPDPFQEFHRVIMDLAETPDHVRLQSLYWQGADGRSIAVSIQRLENVLSGGTRSRLSLFFKDLERLPEPTRERWSRKIRQLTTYEASVLCLVQVDGHVRVLLPLHRSDDGLLIVPADRIVEND